MRTQRSVRRIIRKLSRCSHGKLRQEYEIRIDLLDDDELNSCSHMMIALARLLGEPSYARSFNRRKRGHRRAINRHFHKLACGQSFGSHTSHFIDPLQ